MISLVTASITFYVEYRKSDIYCFIGVIRALTTVVKLPWKFLILIFAVLLPFLEQVDHVFPPIPSLLHNQQFAIVSRSVVATVGLLLQAYTSTGVPNFTSQLDQFQRYGCLKIKKVGVAQTPLAEKFIHVALAYVNAKQHTKFLFPRLISSAIQRGTKIKCGAPDLTRHRGQISV